ncbi:hypothetical protein AAE478_005068 [Parahypoxylon ruwenzoriense]
MARPDVQSDAQRVFEIVKAGGIAICLTNVGYVVMACNAEVLQKIFLRKYRGVHSRHVGTESYAIQEDIYHEMLTPGDYRHSGWGHRTKYWIRDVNKEIIDIEDVVIDYSFLKWWIHGQSSTLLDLSGLSIEIVRTSACYDVTKDVFKRRWNIEPPADPGMESLRFGYLKILDPVESLQNLITPG